jgi:hypothetical protein
LETSQEAGSSQLRVQIDSSRHQVDMQMGEAIAFAKAHRVFFERGKPRMPHLCDLALQQAKLCSLLGAQLMQRFSVAPKHDDQPSTDGCRIRMLDKPMLTFVDDWAWRNPLDAGVGSANQAFQVVLIHRIHPSPSPAETLSSSEEDHA